MDKNAIKKFAVWARTELIARVSLKGVEYGITEGNIEDANVDSVGGKVLTADEKKQRQALIAEINDKGYKQVMEEVAYTWFNRFSALRFMEVNGYIPSHVRVFTDEENNFKPQIITEAIHLDLDGLDMEKVYELKDAEKTEELYKYLLIVQCNALNKILPGMFQRLSDYTELLLPDNLLREGSVIQKMIELIPEDDWKDAVQIIGWLYQYYNSEKSIVENNLYGLDIDDRAAQLAYFAVMMKARQYDRRFFSRGIQPHVYAIVESNHVDKFAVDYFCNGDMKLTASMDTIIKELHDAKEYGSILTVTPQDWSALYDRFAEITEDINMSRETALRELLPLVQVAEALAQKYDVVVTNPPYMGASSMGSNLTNYAKKQYPDSKSDLFAIFIDHCEQMTRKNGFQAMITQHTWMFLSSFEKLRAKLRNICVVNMAHLGARAFEEIGGEVVQTTSFVFRKAVLNNHNGVYCRLVESTTQQAKEDRFLSKRNRYIAQQIKFLKIPGNPLAYWVSDKFANLFEKECVRDVATACIGMRTGNNDRFLRLWYEVENKKIGYKYPSAASAERDGMKWIPYNKGGEFRKWYGNHDYVVNWENDGCEIKENTRRVYPQLGDNLGWKISNEKYYFKEGISWTVVTSKVCFRRYYQGHIFSNSGQSVISDNSVLLDYLTAVLNSRISEMVLAMISPTLGFESGYVNKVPVVIDKNRECECCTIANSNISISKIDWDSFETSWDFQHHPLLRKVPTIAEAFDQWQSECDERFNQLKDNEEELNRIFIDIYGLQDELTPDVEDKDVTVRKADLGRDIRSFISYAVGCMFGRYSLDVEGLAYAGGEWDNSKYDSFAADKDNIIPICDDEYFEDDIVGLFVEFVKTVYGEDTLDENLKFIADALGGKGQPKDVIRNYFLSGFYSDHCKIYQKRPIYWLFDSGKKNGFKALIYMHRYQPDTIARIRTDYVHEQQARYRTAIADLEQRIANASTGERVKLNKKLTTLQAQDTEIRTYEEKIHHLADQMISIDLDDGVKKNYAIFQDVLAKIK